ncbi:hypothetical protein RKD31_003507 [Streptomyces sp. SAI-163]|uniref:DUF4231 domain-containing protein n=2 Tax=unclassified Streptomyces TaxID=2593676 RepID=UPI003C7B7854
MTVHGGDTPIRMVWERQSVWSQAARAKKRSIGRARLLALYLGISAAVLGTLAAQLMSVSSVVGKILAFAAAFAAGAVPIAGRGSSPQEVQDWTRLRSISEALKSEAYVHLARFGAGGGEEASHTLRARIAALESDAADLAHLVNDLQPVERPLPPVRDVETYVEHRVQQQVDQYYRPQTLHMSGRLRRVRRAETTLALTAAALGAVAGAFGVAEAGVWIAVVTAAATAVTMHGAASRYGYQQLEYARTASELEMLQRQMAASTAGASVTTRAEHDFIDRCEEIISVENDGWMVKWTTS